MIIAIYRSRDQQFYFTVETGTNYRVLATSETYHNRSDCKSAAELIRREAGGSHLIDLT